MQKAYDTILADYVDAESAAQNGGSEPYRYECACCWEEVHLCAADSKNLVTHFRHRNGNNNVECENYLGNSSLIINNALSRREIRDKIEFYYLNDTKMFNIGVKFSVEQISAFEQNGASFQVKNEYSSKPDISILIKNSRFLPNVSELIPMITFSWKYYVSISNESIQHKYEVFHKDGHGYLYPSFFKIQADADDNNFKAKLIRSETLYTNTLYLLIFPHQYNDLYFQSDVMIRDKFKFKTMDRDFSGVVIMFTQKSIKTEELLKKWKYKLETSETLLLLWPPSSQVNESIYINAKCAYMFSSFELKAHGNINVFSEDIVNFENGISKVTIKGRTKVYKKNAELFLNKNEVINNEYDEFSVTRASLKNYVAPDNSTYLFNRYGVSLISKGMSVTLIKENEIRHYLFGYLDCIVTALNDSKALVCDHLLHDILIHYKRTEAFNWNDFDALNLSTVAFQYMELCKKTGRINSAVKFFIKEGRI